MLRKSRLGFYGLAMIVGLLTTSSAVAVEGSPTFQAHGRFGLLSTSFTVPSVVTGTYASGNTFDFSIEYLPKKSVTYLLRQQLSFDTVTSSIRYLYTGLGSRFYKGPASRTEAAETGSTFSSLPRWRYYASWDAGVSQMLVHSLTNVFGTTVTLVEFYVGLGTIYQVTRDFGLEIQGEYGNGFGFSNVSASTQTTKILLGATLFF
ncbi:MAG: hypothetical protein V4760_11285 [Bdellovibrionota bacterium]